MIMMATIADLVSNNESIRKLRDNLQHEVNKDLIEKNYTEGLANELKQTFGDAVQTDNHNNISIAYRIIQEQGTQKTGFYDLKTAFARSPKTKQSKAGGWYLKIPISQKAVTFRSAYGRKLWDTISHTQFGSTSGQQANLARFQKILMNSNMNSTPIAYQWKSTNVTRVPFGSSQKRGSYISFRTVSNRSNSNSWLLNRNSINQAIQNNTDNEQQANQVAQIVSSAIEKAIHEYNSKEGETT